MSDYRKDVTLDSLGEVALGNKIDASSGYSVATPQTPKTNALLQLAADLKKVPQIYGQAKNIAQNKALKDVSELSQTQIVSEMSNKDKETMSIFGYDRAYQHGVVQRYLAVKEPEIQQGFLNMANDPEMLKLDAGEFVDALGKKRTEFFEDLSQQFGGNANREEAFNLLGGAVADSLVSSTSKAFLKNKEHQAIAFKSANFNENVPKMGFTKAMNLFRSEMQGLFFLSPKEIKEKMHTTIAARNETLIYNSDYETAREEIKEAMNYSLYKGATLGKVAEDKAKLTKLLANIDKAEEDEDDKFSDNLRGVKRNLDVALTSMTNPDADVEVFKGDLKATFERAGMSEAEAESFVTGIEGKPDINEVMRLVAQASREHPNQKVGELLRGQLSGLKEQKRLYFSGGAHTIGSFEQADMANLEADMRAVLERDPNTSSSRLPVLVDGRSMSQDDPMWIATKKKALEDYNWSRVPSQKGSIVSLTMKAIVKDENYLFREFATEYSGRVLNDLDDAAPALYREAGGDIGIYNQKLQDKANDLFREYGERAEARNNVNAQLTIDLSSSFEQKAKKEGIKNKQTRNFPSFGSYPKPVGSVSTDEVVTDREALNGLDLSPEEKTRLQRASLKRWGFWSADSIDLELMQEAGMGFRDFKLGASVLRDASYAQRVFEAEENETELEPYELKDGTAISVETQKESASVWKKLGFDSVEDFETLERVQQRFYR